MSGTVIYNVDANKKLYNIKKIYDNRVQKNLFTLYMYLIFFGGWAHATGTDTTTSIRISIEKLLNIVNDWDSVWDLYSSIDYLSKDNSLSWHSWVDGSTVIEYHSPFTIEAKAVHEEDERNVLEITLRFNPTVLKLLKETKLGKKIWKLFISRNPFSRKVWEKVIKYCDPFYWDKDSGSILRKDDKHEIT